MTLRNRLNQLEHAGGTGGGACPGCGFRPGDIRGIRFVCEGGGPLPPAPPRDTCPSCGGSMPPLRFEFVPARPEDGP
jgi:hypothetical protein